MRVQGCCTVGSSLWTLPLKGGPHCPHRRLPCWSTWTLIVFFTQCWLNCCRTQVWVTHRKNPLGSKYRQVGIVGHISSPQHTGGCGSHELKASLCYLTIPYIKRRLLHSLFGVCKEPWRQWHWRNLPLGKARGTILTQPSSAALP